MLERPRDCEQAFSVARIARFIGESQPDAHHCIAEAVDCVLEFECPRAFPFQAPQHFVRRDWHPLTDVIRDVLVGSPHPNPTLHGIALALGSS